MTEIMFLVFFSIPSIKSILFIPFGANKTYVILLYYLFYLCRQETQS